MTDYSGNGGGNPFASTSPSTEAPASGSTDPQAAMSQNSANEQSQMGGGDSQMVQPSNQISSSGFLVACLDCGQSGTRKNVTAALKCRCGSANLVFDENPAAVSAVPQSEWSQTDQIKHFASGLVGYVRPEFQGTESTDKWHWALSKDGKVYSHGYAESQEQAREVLETIEPNFARHVHHAAFPPPKGKDDDKDKDKDKSDDKGSPAPPGGSPTGAPPAGGDSGPATPPPVGQPVPPAQAPVAPGAPAPAVPAPGAPPTAPQAPAQPPAAPAAPDAAGPAAGDTDGNTAPPPADDSSSQPGGEAPLGADPKNPTKDAPGEGEAQPGKDPTSAVPAVDPNDPNAPPPGTPGAPVPGQDPAAAGGVQPAEMNGPMDMAQQTLDSVVEQAKQLGHDAMESAYDVDQLFSEWRCNNCGLEGRADISDDGQVAFSGDLLDGPQGCPNPVVGGAPVPGQDPTGQTDPAAAAAPADPAAAPVVPQPAVQAKRKFFRTPWRRTASETTDEINNNRPGLNLHNKPNSLSPMDEEVEDKISCLIESIQLTNPGMNEHTARRIAQETVARFPSVVR